MLKTIFFLSLFLLGVALKNRRRLKTQIFEKQEAARCLSLPRLNSNETEADHSLNLPYLDSDEMARVHSGHLFFKPYRDGLSNKAFAVLLVNAPESVVWEKILDFTNYPRMVDDVQSVSLYAATKNNYKVEIKVGIGFITLTTCLHHVYTPQTHRLTWTLDKEKPSLMGENAGFWVVSPRDDETCIVYYSISIKLKAWVPAWVNEFVSSQGIPRAVVWLKREAERSHQSTSPPLPRETQTRRESAFVSCLKCLSKP